MNGKITGLAVIMNDLSVMGGSFKSKYKHNIHADGTVSYTIYNAVGKLLESHSALKTPEEIELFFKSLVNEAKIFDWNQRYYSDACGGFRWEIDVYSDAGERFNPHGYIKLPPNWSTFAALVGEFSGFPLYVQE